MTEHIRKRWRVAHDPANLPNERIIETIDQHIVALITPDDEDGVLIDAPAAAAIAAHIVRLHNRDLKTHGEPS